MLIETENQEEVSQSTGEITADIIQKKLKQAASVLDTEEISCLAEDVIYFTKNRIQEALEKKAFVQKIEEALSLYLDTDQTLMSIFTEHGIENYTREKGKILLDLIREKISSFSSHQLDRLKDGLEELNSYTGGVFAQHFKVYIKQNILPFIQARYIALG